MDRQLRGKRALATGSLRRRRGLGHRRRPLHRRVRGRVGGATARGGHPRQQHRHLRAKALRGDPRHRLAPVLRGQCDERRPADSPLPAGEASEGLGPHRLHLQRFGDAESCYRTGGENVHVCARHPNGVTENEYQRVLGSNPRAKGGLAGDAAQSGGLRPGELRARSPQDDGPARLAPGFHEHRGRGEGHEERRLPRLKPDTKSGAARGVDSPRAARSK
jgi:hypothetical protein